MKFQEQLREQINAMRGYITQGEQTVARVGVESVTDRLDALKELSMVNLSLRSTLEEFRKLRGGMSVQILDGDKLFRPDFEVLVDIVAPDVSSSKRQKIESSGLHVAYMEPFKVEQDRVVEVTIKKDALETNDLTGIGRLGAMRKLTIAGAGQGPWAERTPQSRASRVRPMVRSS